MVDDYDTISLNKPLGNIDSYDTVRIYVKNRDLYNAILEEMHTTMDIRRYQSLSEAKDLLFYSAMEKKSFNKSDNNPAQTYREMLDDIDPRMGETLDKIEDDDALNELILYILNKLEDTFSSPELRYLYMGTANTYGSLISRYLRIAINVFKASSVQLQSINIFLYAGDSDPVRVIDMEHTHKNVYINDVVHVIDEIATHKTIYLEDYIGVMDKAYPNLK